MANQLAAWRAHFKKMARGEIPYTRDFTIVTTSKQGGKGQGKDLEKLVVLAPTNAGVEIAAAAAEGHAHKSNASSVKSQNSSKKRGTSNGKKPHVKKKTKLKVVGGRREVF